MDDNWYIYICVDRYISISNLHATRMRRTWCAHIATLWASPVDARRARAARVEITPTDTRYGRDLVRRCVSSRGNASVPGNGKIYLVGRSVGRSVGLSLKTVEERWFPIASGDDVVAVQDVSRNGRESTRRRIFFFISSCRVFKIVDKIWIYISTRRKKRMDEKSNRKRIKKWKKDEKEFLIAANKEDTVPRSIKKLARSPPDDKKKEIIFVTRRRNEITSRKERTRSAGPFFFSFYPPLFLLSLLYPYISLRPLLIARVHFDTSTRTRIETRFSSRTSTAFARAVQK